LIRIIGRYFLWIMLPGFQNVAVTLHNGHFVRLHAVISGLKFVLLHKESGRFGVIDKIPLVLQQRST
jgi:hypothetical protein